MRAADLPATPFANDGLFRHALENCPDCVKILDLRGVTQFVNRNGVVILGARDAGELIGRWWPGLWDPREQPVAANAVDGAAGGRVQRFAAPGHVFTGELRHFDNVLSPLRNDAGACVAILVASRDVTELERARLAAEAGERKLAEQAAVLRSAADMAKVAGWSIDRAGKIHLSDEGIRLLHGGERVLSLERAYQVYDPDDHQRIRAQIDRARVTGERFGYDARSSRFDGSRMWIRVYGEGVFEDGVCVGLRGVCMDISDEKAAEETIRRAEQRLVLAAQLTGMHVYELDFETHTVTHQGAADFLLESEPAFGDLYPEPGGLVDRRDRERVRAEWTEATEAGAPFRSEFRVNRRGRQERWAFCVAEFVRDAAGEPKRLLVAIMDVTERKRTELENLHTMARMREQQTHQKLLLDELNHRVKNTLASVQSVAAQTLRDARDVREARDLFLQRLMALSATHNLLVKTAWESASFRELVEMTLGPYGRPYACSGPDLRLDPNFAISFGMALHELTINALKHGAWRGGGHVDIAVEPSATDVRIVWRESGGAPVSRPERRGFGSRLLERGVAGEVHGEVKLEFAPAGLVCRIRAPLSPRLQVIQPQAA